MTNRAPGSIWCLRRDFKPPYVQTADGDLIRLSFQDPNNEHMNYFFELSRKDARLLAKRINQCLDTTTKGKK
jgi:hypothetical protein